MLCWQRLHWHQHVCVFIRIAVRNPFIFFFYRLRGRRWPWLFFVYVSFARIIVIVSRAALSKTSFKKHLSESFMIIIIVYLQFHIFDIPNFFLMANIFECPLRQRINYFEMNFNRQFRGHLQLNLKIYCDWIVDVEDQNHSNKFLRFRIDFLRRVCCCCCIDDGARTRQLLLGIILTKCSNIFFISHVNFMSIGTVPSLVHSCVIYELKPLN